MHAVVVFFFEKITFFHRTVGIVIKAVIQSDLCKVGEGEVLLITSAFSLVPYRMRMEQF